MKRALPKLEVKCSQADEADSRGPGWYCCECNGYNPRTTAGCRFCGHHACGMEWKPADEPALSCMEVIE